MEKTMIEVTRETHRRVMRAKYAMDAKTADEAINRMMDIIEKIGESVQ